MTEILDYKHTEVYYPDHRDEPKQLFVEIADRIELSAGGSPFDLLDVGGASGDFVYYIGKRFPDSACTCIEYDSELVALGQERVPACRYIQGDANDMKEFSDRSFDFVTMTGVHSIFDDFRPSLAESIRVTRDGGRCIITGLFNDYPIDALIYWHYAGDENGLRRGYNFISTQTVSTFLESQDRVAAFRFEPFRIPFDLEKPDDPIRSWTEPGADGERVIINGIMPLNIQSLVLEIS